MKLAGTLNLYIINVAYNLFLIRVQTNKYI